MSWSREGKGEGSYFRKQMSEEETIRLDISQRANLRSLSEPCWKRAEETGGGKDGDTVLQLGKNGGGGIVRG